VAERGQRRLVGRAAVERRLQFVEPLRVVGEDDVLFGAEVPEERPPRNVGRGGDVVDRDRVETPLAEQRQGRLFQVSRRALPVPLEEIELAEGAKRIGAAINAARRSRRTIPV